MGDFTVPINPGWGARFLEKHGDVEDDVQVVSPAFRRAMQKGRLRAQLLKASAGMPDEPISDNADPDAITADRELSVV